jgi:hypothetical protein
MNVPYLSWGYATTARAAAPSYETFDIGFLKIAATCLKRTVHFRHRGLERHELMHISDRQNTALTPPKTERHFSMTNLRQTGKNYFK